MNIIPLLHRTTTPPFFPVSSTPPVNGVENVYTVQSPNESIDDAIRKALLSSPGFQASQEHMAASFASDRLIEKIKMLKSHYRSLLDYKRQLTDYFSILPSSLDQQAETSCLFKISLTESASLLFGQKAEIDMELAKPTALLEEIIKEASRYSKEHANVVCYLSLLAKRRSLSGQLQTHSAENFSTGAFSSLPLLHSSPVLSQAPSLSQISNVDQAFAPPLETDPLIEKMNKFKNTCDELAASTKALENWPSSGLETAATKNSALQLEVNSSIESIISEITLYGKKRAEAGNYTTLRWRIESIRQEIESLQKRLNEEADFKEQAQPPQTVPRLHSHPNGPSKNKTPSIPLKQSNLIRLQEESLEQRRASQREALASISSLIFEQQIPKQRSKKGQNNVASSVLKISDASPRRHLYSTASTKDRSRSPKPTSGQ